MTKGRLANRADSEAAPDDDRGMSAGSKCTQKVRPVVREISGTGAGLRQVNLLSSRRAVPAGSARIAAVVTVGYHSPRPQR